MAFRNVALSCKRLGAAAGSNEKLDPWRYTAPAIGYKVRDSVLLVGASFQALMEKQGLQWDMSDSRLYLDVDKLPNVDGLKKTKAVLKALDALLDEPCILLLKRPADPEWEYAPETGMQFSTQLLNFNSCTAVILAQRSFLH